MARPRCSNAVFASFNVLTLLLGAAVLAWGIYAGAPHRGGGATDCQRFLRTPALVLGAAVMVVSMAGIAGACCRASLLLWLYLFLAALLILATLCFAVFALVVTNAGAGQAGRVGERVQGVPARGLLQLAQAEGGGRPHLGKDQELPRGSRRVPELAEQPDVQ